MKKILFVSLILVVGLFSLQYSLFSNHSLGLTKTHTLEVQYFPICTPPTQPRYEVIYICPDDTLARKEIEKMSEMLL